MNLLMVLILIQKLELNSYLAQALGIPPYTLTTFLASKFIVFRSQPTKNEKST
jgi:putative flippase GtrA